MVDATRLGAWLRSGEGIGWLAAGIIPNYRVPFFFWQVYFCHCSFLFVVSVSFRYVFFCSRWSFVDVPLTFFCPADHVPDWQPRILLGMVEARSLNVKKATTIDGPETRRTPHVFFFSFLFAREPHIKKHTAPTLQRETGTDHVTAFSVPTSAFE